MTGITHAKVSAKEDGEDATLVQPSDWNQPHAISLLGQFTVGWENAGGSALVANKFQDVRAPFPLDITSWTLVADVSGSASVGIWKDTLGNFPPTSDDSITGGNNPSLSSASSATSSSLGGWSTSVATGDVLRFNLDSVSTITKLTLFVAFTRTA